MGRILPLEFNLEHEASWIKLFCNWKSGPNLTYMSCVNIIITEEQSSINIDGILRIVIGDHVKTALHFYGNCGRRCKMFVAVEGSTSHDI